MHGIADIALASLDNILLGMGRDAQLTRLLPSSSVYGHSGYRRSRTTTYFPDGLNGPRAVARRLRQIERGSLTVSNGLVQS